MGDKIKLSNSGRGNLNDWFANVFYNPDVLSRQTKGMSGDDLANAQRVFDAARQDPLSFKKLNINGAEVPNTGIGTTATLGWNKIKAHPWKTAGLGLGVGANLAGLFDNPNIAGQLVGAGAGTAVPFLLNKFAGTSIGGYGKVMSGLIGGGLGSLFDTLMAKKQEQQQQYY